MRKCRVEVRKDLPKTSLIQCIEETTKLFGMQKITYDKEEEGLVIEFASQLDETDIITKMNDLIKQLSNIGLLGWAFI